MLSDDELARLRQKLGITDDKLLQWNQPNPKVCDWEECDKPIEAKGLCSKHYNLQRETDPFRPRCARCERPEYGKGLCKEHWSQERYLSAPPCGVPGCERRQVNRTMQLCLKHYRLTRQAFPEVPRCQVPGCPRAQEARRLCRNHYRQERRAAEKLCTVDGCNSKRRRAGGLCDKHYSERNH